MVGAGHLRILRCYRDRVATFHASEEALRKPGTVGRPRPGSTVRIYDADSRILPAGEVGEIYLWLDGFPDFTYHGQDDKRREVGRDGLVTLGDVGYLDEDGYLFICDRARDMVISGGVNIYPAEREGAARYARRARLRHFRYSGR